MPRFAAYAALVPAALKRKIRTTWNAAANRPMIEINEALGFRLIEQGAGYQKLIPTRDDVVR